MFKMAATSLKKTLTQALSREFCETFKNASFYRIPPVASSSYSYPTRYYILNHLFWPLSSSSALKWTLLSLFNIVGGVGGEGEWWCQFDIKIVIIEGENLHIFWTTWGISMKLSGNMWLMIILKVPTKQDFTLSPEDIFLKKTHGG